MRRALSVVIALAALAGADGCRRPGADDVPASAQPAACVDGAATAVFFPRGVLDPVVPSTDEQLREYYGGFLDAMHEPSVYCRREGRQSVRLLRLEYTGVPVSVRVEHDGRTITAHVVKLEAPTWQLPPGAIVRRQSAPVSAGTWQEIIEALKGSEYWSLATHESRSLDGPGTAWIVEARLGEAYHVVNRASPHDGPYRELGMKLLAVAGVSESELLAGAPGVTPRPFTPQPGMPPPPYDTRPQ